jgi:hypothetical protein
MAMKAVFEGLVVDETGNPVEVAYVGDEPCYVVNDAGFRRHISSEQVDRQVLQMMHDQVKGHEDILSEQTAKMLGQEDPFSRAAIMNQLRNIGPQLDNLLQTGIPEEGRAYLGMLGFRITIDVHGEVVDLQQPTATSTGDGEGGE